VTQRIITLGTSYDLLKSRIEGRVRELKSKDEAGHWVTIEGEHVFIKDGVIEKGPSALVGKDPAHLPPREEKHESIDGVKTQAHPLTGEEHKALDSYMWGNWATLNDSLRRGQELSGSLKEQHETLNRMANDRLEKETVLHRVSVHPLSAIEGTSGKGISGSYTGHATLKGYSSTSLDKSVTDDFTKESVGGSGRDAEIHWQLTAPAGTRGIYADGRLQTSGRSNDLNQKEFILPHGTGISIRQIERTGPKTYTIHAHVMSQGGKAIRND
jgi:hypothetical protein